MKKKVFNVLCIVFILLLGLTLWGCSSNMVDVDVFTNLGIEIYADENSVALVKSYSDLMTYCDEIQAEQYNDNFKTKIMSYDERFFEGKMLILLYHWETTSSSKLTVKDIEVKNENVHVIIKRDIPKIADDALKDYFFIIEVQQDGSCDSATYEVK